MIVRKVVGTKKIFTLYKKKGLIYSLREIYLTLEWLSKVIAVLFPLGLVFGASIVVVYLFQTGMTREIIPILASPPLLISLALCGFIFLAGIVFYSFASPMVLYQLFSSGIGLKSPRKREEFWLHFAIFFLPPNTLLAMATYGFSHLKITAGLASLYVIITGMAARAYRENRLKINGHLIFLTAVAAAIFGTQLVIAFVVMMITPVVVHFYGDGGFAILVFVGFFALYSLLSCIITTRNHKDKFIPLLVLSIAIFTAYIFSDAPKKFANFLGFGGFNATIVVNSKALSVLEESDKFQIKMIGRDAWRVSDLFVRLNTPDKVIVSPSKEDTTGFTITADSVVGGINPLNAHQK